jgi:tRNA/tmRNA/rRNA uracil-C5-methylase (TrmA/RlmC/RlmD family)
LTDRQAISISVAATASRVDLHAAAPYLGAMMSSETPATCPHCAAGPYAGVTYEDELTAKAGLLRRELGGSPRLAAAFDLERVGLRPSPVREGYRGSVKLVFGWDKAAKEAVLGIYEPGSHRLVDLAACREHDPRLDPLLEAVRRGVKERGLPVYREEGGKGFLRYLQARVLPDGRQLACFVTPHAEGGWQETLEEWARELRAQLPQLFSVCQNLNPGRGNAVLGPVTTLLEGQFTVPCRFLETPVAVSATSFQQANLPVFRAILAELRGWVDGLGAEARVADLYCGCGAIGLSVTRRQPLFLLEADHASQIPLMEAARADGREAAGWRIASPAWSCSSRTWSSWIRPARAWTRRCAKPWPSCGPAPWPTSAATPSPRPATWSCC